MRHDQLEQKRRNKGATTIYGSLLKEEAALLYIYCSRARSLPKRTFLFIFLWINKFAYMWVPAGDNIQYFIIIMCFTHMSIFYPTWRVFVWWELKIWRLTSCSFKCWSNDLRINLPRNSPKIFINLWQWFSKFFLGNRNFKEQYWKWQSYVGSFKAHFYDKFNRMRNIKIWTLSLV